MEGVLIVAPLKMPSFSLPSFPVIRKIFGIGRPGVNVSRRSTAFGESTTTPCAPSPPSTFCHENVVASSFSHGISIAKTAEVASHSVTPSRSAGIQSAGPAGTRTPDVVPLYVKIASFRPS